MVALLHHALDRAVAEYPDRPAVVDGDRDLSYSELDDRSRRLAQYLVDAGLAPGDRVAIHQFKSIEMLIAIYGVLRAGCCFVPVDPTSPRVRVKAILDDCQVRAVVTDRRAHAVLETLTAPTVQLVVHGADVEAPATAAATNASYATWSEMNSYVSQSDLPQVAPGDLAYVMYTSGSTGPPKGMMHSHSSSLGFAGWGYRYCELTADDVVANFSPLHFDISVFDLFSSILSASCVVLVAQHIQAFPAQVSELLARTSTSVVFTVPFALTRLARAGSLNERDLTRLRWVLFGGEPFQPSDLAELMRQLPHARFANVYGPAEAPACVTHEVPHTPQNDEPVPIGQLAPDTTGLIVKAGTVDSVDPEEAGELLISAPSITLGYWNRADLNAKTRVVVSGQEFFRTGDVVRETNDGLLYLFGRSDRMIKSRGFRIELDEVEAALATCDGVEEAAAFAVADGETKLVYAAVVANTGAVDAAGLRRELRDRLPTYAIPTHLDVVADFPRTTSDKIDRRALAARYQEHRG